MKNDRHEEAIRLIRWVVGRCLARDFRQCVDREVVFQDAYLAAYDLIESNLEAEFSLIKAQIAAIASNIAASAMRHAFAQRRGGSNKIARLTSKSGTSLVNMYALEDGTQSASRYLSRKEIIAVLRIALRSLPQQQRRIAQLHWLDGWNRVRIGEFFGLNVNTVNTILFRVKDALAKKVSSAVGGLTSL